MSGYQNELVRIKEALKVNPRGMTISEISREINVNRNSVAKYLDVMLISGQVEMRPVGRAKLYFISQRVPLSAMLNLSSEYITVFNREYRMVQVNDAFLDLLNIEREAIIGKELKDAPSYIFNKPYFRSGLKKGFDGIVSSKELSFQIRDAELYLRIKFIPTTFDDGEQGTTIIMENITERKKVERALRESEGKFRELSESISDTFFAMDGNLRYTYWNEASEKLTGIRAEDAIGKSIFEIFPDREDTRRAVAAYRRVLQTRQPETFLNEYQLEGKDYFFEISAYPTEDGVSVFVKDITERKRAEEELRFKNAMLKAMFKTSPDGILVVDREGKAVLFNSRFGEMWGIPQDILDTRAHEKLIQSVLDQLKEPKAFLEKVEYLYAHEDKKSQDEVEFKDGRVFDRHSYPLLDTSDSYMGRIWYFRDITERKRAR